MEIEFVSFSGDENADQVMGLLRYWGFRTKELPPQDSASVTTTPELIQVLVLASATATSAMPISVGFLRTGFIPSCGESWERRFAFCCRLNGLSAPERRIPSSARSPGSMASGGTAVSGDCLFGAELLSLIRRGQA